MGARRDEHQINYFITNCSNKEIPPPLIGSVSKPFPSVPRLRDLCPSVVKTFTDLFRKRDYRFFTDSARWISSNRLPDVSCPINHNATAASSNGPASNSEGTASPGNVVKMKATAFGPTTPPTLLLLAVTPVPVARSFVG